MFLEPFQNIGIHYFIRVCKANSRIIKSDVIVRNGDKVVTSNISDKYLQGILIGYVKDVKLDSNNLTQSGYIVPAVDFNNLQEVLVITQLKE